MRQYAKETKIVHGTHSSYTTSMDLAPPIHMTSTFTFENAEQARSMFAGEEEGFVYTRIGNPSVTLLQEKTAALEGGQAAIATASGMAAIASAAMSLTAPGDNFVSCTTVYGGTFALFSHHFKKLQIEARFISPSLSNTPGQAEKLIDGKTRFLYLETPANPTLDIIDIEMWGGIARRFNIPLIVDNTFASPFLQSPLALGAELVIHSATKYLGGHGDVIGGMIVGSRDMITHIEESYCHHFGPAMSPFNAWLISRGIKTLALRMERHSQNALKIARRLKEMEGVEQVYYPGLPDHPGHEIAKRQMTQFGGMIAFEVAGGIRAGRTVMDNVRLCSLAVSLGDCESLIQHPASMTHATYTPEERKKAGISDGLIRLSVGLEDADDIIADLAGAIRAVKR